MKYSTSMLLASAGWASALTQQCSSGVGSTNGKDQNYYCGAVSQILYQNVERKGSFKAVTKMGPSGECVQEDKPYGGPMAPFNEDLSLHFRGPLRIKKVAVYNLASKKKRNEIEVEAEAAISDTKVDSEEGKVEIAIEASPKVAARHEHGHQRLHRAHRAKRADMVTATIDGKVVSWVNNWFGGAPTDKPAAVPVPTVNAAAGAAVSSSNKSGGSKKPKGKPAPSGSDWDRVAYYDAEKETAENIVFMANYGGQGSGVWDPVWGNSLSYLNANGDGGSASPQTLKDIYIPSDKEFSIFSAEKCDAECGFSRAADIAYKGFGGANKVFLFEFKMPLDGKLCPNPNSEGLCPGLAPDMPAIWALNSRIPRAAQYNKCSCWTTGCGEIDIFEVLSPGAQKCKTTFHMANGAGSSDYFDRPVDKFIKVATIFHENTGSVSIKKVSDNVDFSKGLDDKTVLEWLNQPTDEVELKVSSLFQMLG